MSGNSCGFDYHQSVGRRLLAQTLFGLILINCAALSQTATYDALAASQLEHARNELTKTAVLVQQGTLPRIRLAEAQEQVADAEDNLTLARTLYSDVRLENMTPEQAAAMTGAAKRRVERKQALVESRRTLVASGILARADFESDEEELASRRHVLEMAENRARLMAELQAMAEAERRLEQAANTAVMIRYGGTGEFQMNRLPAIAGAFQRRFGKTLPVSALGQTLVHQALGLDHRNRVDVALSPDSAEGVWLRRYLEKSGIPYLAFRSAVAGAATAPHIHIGSGSPRLGKGA